MLIKSIWTNASVLFERLTYGWIKEVVISKYLFSNLIICEKWGLIHIIKWSRILSQIKDNFKLISCAYFKLILLTSNILNKENFKSYIVLKQTKKPLSIITSLGLYSQGRKIVRIVTILRNCPKNTSNSILTGFFFLIRSISFQTNQK